jgi:hypothetical protein
MRQILALTTLLTFTAGCDQVSATAKRLADEYDFKEKWCKDRGYEMKNARDLGSVCFDPKTRILYFPPKEPL